jgi:hypothetical protein
MPQDETSCAVSSTMEMSTQQEYKNSMPEVVLTEIETIYKYTAHPDLFMKRLHERTQNSDSPMIAIRKNSFCRLNTMRMVLWTWVTSVNEGNLCKIKVLKELKEHPLRTTRRRCCCALPPQSRIQKHGKTGLSNMRAKNTLLAKEGKELDSDNPEHGAEMH